MDYRTAKGMLMATERQRLYELALEMASIAGKHVALNLGVEFGASMICLRQGCPDAELYGVDIDFGPLEDSVKKELGPKTFYVQEDSRSYVPKVVLANELRINLAFVDGSHYLDIVSSDAELSQLIVRGGCIAFHDAYWWDHPETPQPQVYPAIDEWSAKYHNQWRELPKAGTMRIFRRIV